MGKLEVVMIVVDPLAVAMASSEIRLETKYGLTSVAYTVTGRGAVFRVPVYLLVSTPPNKIDPDPLCRSFIHTLECSSFDETNISHGKWQVGISLLSKFNSVLFSC